MSVGDKSIVTDGLIYAFSGRNPKGYSGTDMINMVDGSVDGTLTNGVSVGNEFDFDGTNDYISVSPAIGFGASERPLTVDLWFSADGPASNNVRPVLSRSSGRIHFNYQRRTQEFTNNEIRLWVMNAMVTGGAGAWFKTIPNYSRYDWMHVSFHIPATPDIEVFVNGVSEGVQSFDSYDGLTDLNWIGILQDIYPNFIHNGKIGDIKIYNRLLTADEIKQNYDAIKYRFD